MKAPKGCHAPMNGPESLETQLFLTLFLDFLISDVSADLLLLQADGAHPVPLCPEMQAPEVALLPKNLTLEPDRLLPFQ